METERLLNFSSELGRRLLQNGAEIYRVEESIEFLLAAYGYRQVEVFAIPAFIVLNIQTEERNYNRAVRVRASSLNLRKLHRLNALCRDLCRETPDLEEAQRRFDAVLAEPRYSKSMAYLSYGMVAMFFTLFWGGNVVDAAVAFGCGLLIRAIVSFMSRVRANVFFTNLVAAALADLPATMLAMLGGPVHMDKIIIGTIMLLVPGLAITNVMRDVLAGDFLTALTRFAEVLIVAMGISIGVAIAIMVPRSLMGL